MRKIFYGMASSTRRRNWGELIIFQYDIDRKKKVTVTGRRRRRRQYIHFSSHKIICFTWNKHSETLHSLRYITFFSFFFFMNASSLSLSLVVGYEDILMGKNNKWTWWEKEEKCFAMNFLFLLLGSPLLLNRREIPSPAAAAAAVGNIPWQSYERRPMTNIKIVMKWRGILKCCWKMSSLMIDWWWTKLFNKNSLWCVPSPPITFFLCFWFLFYYQFNSNRVMLLLLFLFAGLLWCLPNSI